MNNTVNAFVSNLHPHATQFGSACTLVKTINILGTVDSRSKKAQYKTFILYLCDWNFLIIYR